MILVINETTIVCDNFNSFFQQFLQRNFYQNTSPSQLPIGSMNFGQKQNFQQKFASNNQTLGIQNIFWQPMPQIQPKPQPMSIYAGTSNSRNSQLNLFTHF